jgi:hypothetical protein
MVTFAPVFSQQELAVSVQPPNCTLSPLPFQIDTPSSSSFINAPPSPSSLELETATPDPNLETMTVSYPDETVKTYTSFINLDLSQVKSLSDLPRNLTAKNINPAISLTGVSKSPVDFTIVAYQALVSYMGSMLMRNDYIPSALEARQVLEGLPREIPLLTFVNSPTEPQSKSHWYLLKKDDTFENYEFDPSNGTYFSNWLNNLISPPPLVQSAQPIQSFAISAQPVLPNETVALEPSAEPKAKFVVVPENQNAGVQFEQAPALVIEKIYVNPVQSAPVDVSAIAPAIPEFELLDEGFWKRLEKKSFAEGEPVPVEIKFEFAEG